jgi:hypothetical protein
VALIVLVGLAFGLWNVLAAAESGQLNLSTALRVLVVWSLAAIPFLAFHGLRRRKAYGRWLSVLILLFWLGSQIRIHPNPFSLGQDDCGGGPVPCFQYSNPAQEQGAREARIAVEGGIIVLVFRLVFAKSVKAYFQSPLLAAGTPSQETTGA